MAHQTGRSYTRARRFPWVIGRIQGWTIPLGPYSATQLGVLLGGLWLVVQTYGLWSRLGPAAVVVLAAPPVATWAVRHAKIEGRSPLRAASGLAAQLAEPPTGRIGGRIARDAKPNRVHGTIRVTALPPVRTPAATSARSRPPRRPGRISKAARPQASAADARRPEPARVSGGRVRGPGARPAPTALQRMLADATDRVGDSGEGGR